MTLRRAASLGTALACALAFAAQALGAAGEPAAQVPASLVTQAQSNPAQLFHVIVQGDSSAVAQAVTADKGNLKRKFRSIGAVAADVTGQELLQLTHDPHVSAISVDAPLASADYQDASMYLASVDATPLIGASAPQTPAIAIVDSGIDATDTPVFGSRIVASVNLSSLSPGATGDQQGHGTIVAALAAGAAPSGNPNNNGSSYGINYWGGVAQSAPLVDVRTADWRGESRTSDVIAACDWILAHKAQYNIRVANFSMVGSTQTSFQSDPLDKAVEKLWFNGVVVVAAAGNFGSAGTAVDMSYAPGNDPFVITVGAADQHSTATTSDDTIAPWSAYGHTGDGFAKPELSAPGRYLVGAVNTASAFPQIAPTRVRSLSGVFRIHTYMWMSGTSFAAPIVAGAAAQILARHPGWTPDQVKGALMLSARYLPLAGFAGGVGEIDAAAAAALANPPNPNENLDAFVVSDPATGQRTFDAAKWAGAVSADPSWSSANWGSANWGSANWGSSNWTSAKWGSSTWATSNWTMSNWTSSNWTSSNWTSSSSSALVWVE